MTVCMNAIPTTNSLFGMDLSCPLVLADTIATMENNHGFPIVIPTNFTPENLNSISQAVLYRKLYILDEVCALAFAGNGTKIGSCFDKIVAEKSEWINSDNPMKYVQDVANDFGEDLWVLGGSIVPRNLTLNTIFPPGRSYKFKCLGKCYISGSGTPDLLRNIVQFEERMSKEVSPPDGIAAHWLAIDINALRLADEVNGRTGGWGGYVEHAYLDRDNHRWQRGPRALHLFMESEWIQGDRVGLK